MRDVEISKEPVALFKILKFEGMVGSGGEAKAVIDDGEVMVNGVVETRRRCKIVSGDIIDFRNEQLRIVTGRQGGNQRLMPAARGSSHPTHPRPESPGLPC
jgi:ribosome-associated protein